MEDDNNMAASNLPGEFQRYNRHIRQLKQIVRETKRAFQDINTFGNLDQGEDFAVCQSCADDFHILVSNFILSCSRKAKLKSEGNKHFLFSLHHTLPL